MPSGVEHMDYSTAFQPAEVPQTAQMPSALSTYRGRGR